MTPDKLNENFEKSRDIKKEYLADFINYRNNYIEDMPTERLMPGDKNYYLYKCRGHFFISIMGRIGSLIDKGIIKNPEAILKGNKFIAWLQARDPAKFYTRDDIDKANEILDYMIKELS
jgi:hypothetical protein